MSPAKSHLVWPWFPLGWVRNLLRGGGAPYMDRFSVFEQKSSGSNSGRLYLHHFLSGDDAGHHNHPFKWSFSLVLWGSYDEEVLDFNDMRIDSWGPGFNIKMAPAIRTRRVRWFNFIRADKYHRIVKLHPGLGSTGVWTLFYAGQLARAAAGKKRGWGFWEPGVGHIPHEEYTKKHQVRKGVLD